MKLFNKAMSIEKPMKKPQQLDALQMGKILEPTPPMTFANN